MQFLSGRLDLRRNLVARLALGYSLGQNNLPPMEFKDSLGLEFNRATLTGIHELVFKLLISESENRFVPDHEFFPTFVRVHIENGIHLLYDKYQKINSPTEFLLQLVDR